MNSEIILCKGIKLDKNYINVLSYGTEAMINLCRQKAINIQYDYSFIRQNKNRIYTNFTYNECLQANYLAFRNPDYSGKWFFAFIDDVVYTGDNNTEIYYTIDVWSTWFSDWQKNKCYIIRQHVNSDKIGEHTLPEGLDTGEYISNDSEENKVYDMKKLVTVLQVTQTTTGEEILATNFGGIWQAGGAYVTDDINALINIIQSFGEGKNDAIINAYLVPSVFIETDDISLRYKGQDKPISIEKEILKPKNLNGYIPKNNKLFTFPYVYLTVSNNNGVSNNYQFELFNDEICKFDIKGIPVCGGSIKLVPLNYKFTNSYNEEEGIMAGKYPTLSWSEDAYTNWLTQNAVNLGIGLTTNIASIISGIATNNGGAIAIGSVGIANQLGEKYQRSLVPTSAQGNTNGGDINTSSNCNNFYFYSMTIKKEYAEVIDNYFTRFGYKINKLETPNIVGRKNWNYVEIGQNESIGYGDVPSNFMEQINNACRKGVTIWHNHDNIGNYNLDNSII